MTVGRLPIQITMLGAVLLTGCTQEPIVRNIELAAAPVPPSATSRLDQSSIVVETDNVEALASGHRLVIWAVTEAGLVALGPMIPGTPAEVSPATAAITLSDVRELVVTEEANSATLPVEASQVVVLRGPVEGTLHFGDGVGADAFATAHGTARIEDDRIDVTLEELPPLPVGTSTSPGCTSTRRAARVTPTCGRSAAITRRKRPESP